MKTYARLTVNGLCSCNISTTSESVFIRVSKHRENDENTGPKAERSYCFEVFGK